MVKSKRASIPLVTGTAVLSLIAWLQGNGQAAVAAPTATTGYSVSLFASNPTGASQPDSIAISGNNVFVGYGNGTKSDGSDGLPTTIGEYTTSGQLVQTFSVPGHNDGLRIDPTTGQVFALQNQDGNPSLTTINPITGAEQTYALNSINGGGGYDDLAFQNGNIYVDAANPTFSGSVNNQPVLGTLSVSGGQATVTPVLSSDNGLTQLNTATGQTETFNLTDPDSLGFSSNGGLTIDGEGDKALYTITNLGTPQQQVSVLPHPTFTADDNVVAPTTPSSLIIADTSGGAVYQLSGPFAVGATYISSSSGNSVGTLDPTGTLTAAVSGLGSPHGLGFLPNSSTQSVPEPNSALSILVFGALGAGFMLKRQLKRQNLAG
ncbi:MAG: hypothetical protein JOZ78_21935 [Chroococcidiopsidaceae cyanobacterium CP_BM_ER_R8_30]|nr:hypothetical protein [Chroococcidiopsidaceae cyanobacterium CP_BM_ER_R8_30]